MCFDLDGVLIHTMPYHARAWVDTSRAARLPLLRREVYAWEGEPGMVTAMRLLKRSGARGNLAARARQLLIEKERRFTALGTKASVSPAWSRHLIQLRGLGLRLALVTGTSRRELIRLLPAGLLRIFDVVVTGDAVRQGKPHPEPYLAACRRLRIPAERAVVVENAPYGIQSARRAGAGCIVALASSLPPEYLADADVVLHDARQVRALLVKLARLGSLSARRSRPCC